MARSTTMFKQSEIVVQLKYRPNNMEGIISNSQSILLFLGLFSSAVAIFHTAITKAELSTLCTAVFRVHVVGAVKTLL